MSDLNPRVMSASDRRFVVPVWAQGARWKGLTKDERFRRVDKILEGGCRVVVLARDERTVHAFAAGANGRLFFAYVPPELRGEGLARRVITELLGSYPDVIQITHPWPFASERFRFPHEPRTRKAA